MSVSQKPNWLELPDLVFDKVMLMIGLSCLEALDRCRQVCTTWNVILLRKLWENPSKSWGIVIRRRIEKSWGLISTLPSVEDVEIVPLGTLLLSIGKLSRKKHILISFFSSGENQEPKCYFAIRKDDCSCQVIR